MEFKVVGEDRGFVSEGLRGIDLFEFDAGADGGDCLLLETLVRREDGRLFLHRCGTVCSGSELTELDAEQAFGWIERRILRNVSRQL